LSRFSSLSKPEKLEPLHLISVMGNAPLTAVLTAGMREEIPLGNAPQHRKRK